MSHASELSMFFFKVQTNHGPAWYFYLLNCIENRHDLDFGELKHFLIHLVFLVLAMV